MSSHRLLFVEDNRELIFLCSRPLQKQGFNILEAWDMAQAFRVLGHNHFDVVVTDLNLPDGNGVELIRMIRSQGKDTLIVVVSGAKEEILEEARQAGADIIVAKPFIIDRLIHQIESLLKAKHPIAV